MAAKDDVDLTGVRPAEVPRYRLTERAYINDQLKEIGEEVDWPGVPGWHMHPLNRAAENMVGKHRPQPFSVIDELTKIGGGNRGGA